MKYPPVPVALGLILCQAFALPCFAGGMRDPNQPVVVTNEPTGSQSTAPVDEETLADYLAEPISVDLEDAALKDVIDAIFPDRSINVWVNWPALEAAGFEPTLPITVRLHDLPREEVSRLVLQSASTLCEFDPISLSAYNGVITISTERDLNKTSELRIYSIGPWLRAMDQTRRHNQPDVSAELQMHRRAESIESLINLIQDLIGRQEDWAAYGGDVSSLQELNGQLIVQSTPQNHRDIDELLAMLHEQEVQATATRMREAEIDQLLAEADAMRMNQEYDGALERVELAERVDPENIRVVAMKRVLTETMSRQ